MPLHGPAIESSRFRNLRDRDRIETLRSLAFEMSKLGYQHDCGESNVFELFCSLNLSIATN